MSKKVYIIAEAGVNHNGSLELAKKLVDVAAEAGADAVKFQTFKADKLVSKTAKRAEYQIANTGTTETQYEMIKKLELSDESHHALISYCQDKKIHFLSTPFDLESLDLLANQLKLPVIKLPSGDITNAPLLLETARTKKPVILSTGMCNLGEIETALGILAFGFLDLKERPSLNAFERAYYSVEGHNILKEKVTLLHCTTEYPAPLKEVNLNVMATMREAFGLPVGYSDHTNGIAVSVAAVALGATIIEKHFTLDKNMPGPDHKASLEPHELIDMVKSIRDVEVALGSALKKPAESEVKNKSIARKSLVVSRDIKKGEIFSEENLSIKRPGDGVSPFHYWEWLGKAANKDYAQDEKVNND